MLSRRTFLTAAAASAAIPNFAKIASAQTPVEIVVMAKGIDDVVNGFDPAQAYLGTDYEITSNTYRMLVTLDPEDGTRYISDLAESWEVAEDGLTITFILRDDVVFESGNPVTAEDVRWSIWRLMKMGQYPATDYALLGWSAETIDEIVEAVDERTFVIHMPEVRAPGTVLNTLASPRGCVVDKLTALEHEVDGDMGNAWLRTHSAGSGSYKLTEWLAGDRIILDANPNAEVQPNVPRLLIRNVADPATQLLLLEQDDIDIARDLGSDQLPSVREQDDLVEVSALTTAQMNIVMNQDHEILSNPLVIQAIKWAVDCEAIANNITPGIWDVWQASFLPSNVKGAVPSTFYKDSDRARQLLEEAGYPDGFSITLDHFAAWPWANIAQAIQSDMAEIGIDVQLVSADQGQVITKYRAREHELALVYWATNLYDPDYNARTWCINIDDSEDSELKTQAWRNHFIDDDMAARADAAGKELDEEVRAEMYHQLQIDFMERAPVSWLLQMRDIAVHRAETPGLHLGGLAYLNRFAGITKS